jgi:hypothetical protein
VLTKDEQKEVYQQVDGLKQQLDPQLLKVLLKVLARNQDASTIYEVQGHMNTTDQTTLVQRLTDVAQQLLGKQLLDARLLMPCMYLG